MRLQGPSGRVVVGSLSVGENKSEDVFIFLLEIFMKLSVILSPQHGKPYNTWVASNSTLVAALTYC